MSSSKTARCARADSPTRSVVDEAFDAADKLGWHHLSEAENGFVHAMRRVTYRARLIVWEMIVAMYVRYLGKDSFITDMVASAPKENHHHLRKVMKSPLLVEIEALRSRLKLTNVNNSEWRMILVMRRLSPPAVSVISEIARTMIAFHPWRDDQDGIESNTEIPEGIDDGCVTRFVDRWKTAPARRVTRSTAAPTSQTIEAAP